MLIATVAFTLSSLTMAQVDTPFRFKELPVELRLAILCQTGLVTPTRLVYLGTDGWSIDLGTIKYKRRFRYIRHHSWEKPTALFLVSHMFNWQWRWYKVTNKISNCDFYADNIINEVRALINFGVWPMRNVPGGTLERFVVHVDTGARNLFASSPD
ncbi:hypothetical protein PGQ11_011045 [Apiospora arundinis]|uniref:Secreted protein n=1 Tax=Apiospora arundinis TaxID=335852 RepID=A0ABR2HYD4_9PEZI